MHPLIHCSRVTTYSVTYCWFLTCVTEVGNEIRILASAQNTTTPYIVWSLGLPDSEEM